MVRVDNLGACVLARPSIARAKIFLSAMQGPLPDWTGRFGLPLEVAWVGSQASFKESSLVSRGFRGGIPAVDPFREIEQLACNRGMPARNPIARVRP